jgi:hypothetical protein
MKKGNPFAKMKDKGKEKDMPKGEVKGAVLFKKKKKK